MRLTFPKARPGDIFYNGCEPEVRDQALAAMAPNPARPFLGGLTLSGAGAGFVSKYFIEWH